MNRMHPRPATRAQSRRASASRLAHFDNAPAFLASKKLKWWAVGEAEPRHRLVLLIDDANSMPLATARGLGALLARGRGRLCAVLATSDDAASSRVLAALDTETREVRLNAPLTEPETRAYVSARLAWAGGSDAPLDAATVSRLHKISGGVPRRLHAAALSLFEDLPAHLRPAAETATGACSWLGQPIDELSGDAGELPKCEYSGMPLPEKDWLF